MQVQRLGRHELRVAVRQVMEAVRSAVAVPDAEWFAALHQRIGDAGDAGALSIVNFTRYGSPQNTVLDREVAVESARMA